MPLAGGFGRAEDARTGKKRSKMKKLNFSPATSFHPALGYVFSRLRARRFRYNLICRNSFAFECPYQKQPRAVFRTFDLSTAKQTQSLTEGSLPGWGRGYFGCAGWKMFTFIGPHDIRKIVRSLFTVVQCPPLCTSAYIAFQF